MIVLEIFGFSNFLNFNSLLNREVCSFSSFEFFGIFLMSGSFILGFRTSFAFVVLSFLKTGIFLVGLINSFWVLIDLFSWDFFSSFLILCFLCDLTFSIFLTFFFFSTFKSSISISPIISKLNQVYEIYIFQSLKLYLL